MRRRDDVADLAALLAWLLIAVPFAAATVLSPVSFGRALLLSAWDVPRAPAILASWLAPAWSWMLPTQVRTPMSPAPADLSSVPMGRATASGGGYRLAVEVVPAQFGRRDVVRVSVTLANAGAAPLPLPQVQLRATPPRSAWPVWARNVTPRGEGAWGLPGAVCADGTECLAPGETARWAGLMHGYELGREGTYVLRVQVEAGPAAAVRYEVAPQAVAPHTVTADAGPWRITLSTPRGTYAQGEPVTVHVTVWNRSAQPQPLSDSMVPRAYVSLVRAGSGELRAQWPVDVPTGYVVCADRPAHTEYSGPKPPQPPNLVACLPPGGRAEAEFIWPGALPLGAQPEPAPRYGRLQGGQRMGALDSPPDGWDPVPVDPGTYVLAVGLGPTARVTVRSRETVLGGLLLPTPLGGYPGVIVVPVPTGSGYWVTQPYQARLAITVR